MSGPVIWLCGVAELDMDNRLVGASRSVARATGGEPGELVSRARTIAAGVAASGISVVSTWRGGHGRIPH